MGYAGVTLDQIPCGSPVDPLRIPLVYALTPGGSAGDSQGILSSVTPALGRYYVLIRCKCVWETMGPLSTCRSIAPPLRDKRTTCCIEKKNDLDNKSFVPRALATHVSGHFSKGKYKKGWPTFVPRCWRKAMIVLFYYTGVTL